MCRSTVVQQPSTCSLRKLGAGVAGNLYSSYAAMLQEPAAGQALCSASMPLSLKLRLLDKGGHNGCTARCLN